VLAVLRAIFLYAPRERATAAALARHPLWTAPLHRLAELSGWP